VGQAKTFMAEHLIIRDYLDSDFVRAEQIHDLARPIELEGSCDPRGFVPLAKDKADLNEFLTSKKFVAILSDEFVGFVGIQPLEIGWLYVDPLHFDQGIGRRLLKHGLSKLSVKDNDIEVHVLAGNNRARKLYESEGFVESERFEVRNNGYPCKLVKLVLAQ